MSQASNEEIQTKSVESLNEAPSKEELEEIKRDQEEAEALRKENSFLRRLIYVLAGLQQRAFEAPSRVATPLGQAVEAAYPHAAAAYGAMMGQQTPAQYYYAAGNQAYYYPPSYGPVYYYIPRPRWIRTSLGWIDTYALNEPGIYGEIMRMRWQVMLDAQVNINEINDALYLDDFLYQFDNFARELFSLPSLLFEFRSMIRELNNLFLFF